MPECKRTNGIRDSLLIRIFTSYSLVESDYLFYIHTLRIV